MGTAAAVGLPPALPPPRGKDGPAVLARRPHGVRGFSLGSVSGRGAAAPRGPVRGLHSPVPRPGGTACAGAAAPALRAIGERCERASAVHEPEVHKLK